jgi:3-methyl-2-oxobutanoate hydroxymethyltransferase
MEPQYLAPTSPKRVTVPSLKDRDEKIVCLTAYDYTTARILDEAGVDLILVGDSVAAVVQGLATTIPVTLDEMIYHCRCVARGVSRALLVGDMPFLSYQVSREDALRNAGRLVKEGGVAAVKLEGGCTIATTVKALVDAEIPVLGHVGLTPQAYHRMGGHRVQGRVAGDQPGERGRVLRDALAVEEAGAFALVLEGIPADLGAEISERLTIPTIGIGAGPACDGQILVTHDMLGFFPKAPRFAKRYADVVSIAAGAVGAYIREVRDGSFPAPEHTYGGE